MMKGRSGPNWLWILGLVLLSGPATCRVSWASDILQAIPGELRITLAGGDATERFTVELVNPGVVPVRISGARTSCPCVRVVLPPQTLEPGMASRFEIFTEGQDQFGTHEYQVTVYGEPASRILLAIPLTVHVPPPAGPVFQFFPERLFFLDLGREQGTVRLILKNPGTEVLTVNQVSRQGGIVMEPSPVQVPPGGKVTVQVKLHFGDGSSSEGILHLAGNDPQVPAARIPFQVR